MTEQLTPNAVVTHLLRLSEELDVARQQLADLDDALVRRRREYRLAKARATLEVKGGNAAERAANVALAIEEERFAAEVAQQMVRASRDHIGTLKMQIEVGRSAGAAVRAEISLERS